MGRDRNQGAKASGSLLTNPHVRSVVFQILAIVAVLALAWFIGNNTAENLKRQGVASGFGFFEKPTGFAIIQHLIPYDEQSSNFRAFIVALLNTLLVSGIGVVLATILGFVIGIARLSTNLLVSKLALIYVEILRNVPLLLQLFFWYFGVLRALPAVKESLDWGGLAFVNIRGLYIPRPIFESGAGLWGVIVAVAIVVAVVAAIWARRHQREIGGRFPVVLTALGGVVIASVVGFLVSGRPLSWELPTLGTFNFVGGLSLIPELLALLLALSTYTAAFIAEIVRSGIQSVNRGQLEAATALGLSRAQTLRFVVIPQALRLIIPPLTSQFLNLTKNSSMAAVIAYPDLVLVFAGTILMQTGQAVEVVAVTMAVYLTLSLLISGAMNIYNRRTALIGR